MKRIPFEQAVESLLAVYTLWLKENPENLVRQWSEFFDQQVTVVNRGGDPPDLQVEIEAR